jgi:threonine synthase
MKYTSTRDRTISCTFEEAICSGYAPDGGLFVPEELPAVSVATLKEWAKLDYPHLAQTVLRLFVSESEVSPQELSEIVTYQGFIDPVVPIQRVGSLYVAELFHGPTFCFKDLGMRAVVQFLSLFATKQRQHMTLLVSTTGDTGPAAVQAVSDANHPRLTILVHYPAGQISSFQRKQLTTIDSPNVHVVAFEGGGDDMDLPIKNMLKSPPSGSHWTGVNSYNIGRPLMQMIHYIWTYLRVAEQEDWEIGKQKLDIILPTGAMGNLGESS